MEIINKNNPKVAVVISIYRKQDFIKNCLDSLLNQNYDNYDIIVINDGSEDDTNDIIFKQYKDNHKITFYDNKRNKGATYSRNFGMKNSEADIIAYMDTDCIAEKNWLEELIKPFFLDDKIAVVGGRISDPPKPNYWQLVMAGIYFLSNDSGYTNKSMIAANMAVLRDFHINNPFDETVKYGGSEPDLCYRAKKQGYKIYYQDSANVTHYHRATYKKNDVQIRKIFNIKLTKELKRTRLFTETKGILLCFSLV